MHFAIDPSMSLPWRFSPSQSESFRGGGSDYENYNLGITSLRMCVCGGSWSPRGKCNDTSPVKPLVVAFLSALAPHQRFRTGPQLSCLWITWYFFLRDEVSYYSLLLSSLVGIEGKGREGLLGTRSASAWECSQSKRHLLHPPSPVPFLPSPSESVIGSDVREQLSEEVRHKGAVELLLPRGSFWLYSE